MARRPTALASPPPRLRSSLWRWRLRTACSRKLNLAWQSGRPCQMSICRDERNSEPSGKRHVGRVVTGDVGPKPPHVGQQRYDRVPLDITPRRKGDHLSCCPPNAKGAAQTQAAEDVEHLNIESVGHVDQ